MSFICILHLNLQNNITDLLSKSRNSQPNITHLSGVNTTIANEIINLTHEVLSKSFTELHFKCADRMLKRNNCYFAYMYELLTEKMRIKFGGLNWGVIIGEIDTFATCWYNEYGLIFTYGDIVIAVFAVEKNNYENRIYSNNKF